MLPAPYSENIGGFRGLGIYGINGPNWETDLGEIETLLPGAYEQATAWTRFYG